MQRHESAGSTGMYQHSFVLHEAAEPLAHMPRPPTHLPPCPPGASCSSSFAMLWATSYTMCMPRSRAAGDGHARPAGARSPGHGMIRG